jgi:hypothetical protein
MSGCERNGHYAYTCRQCWPRTPDKWCDTCFQRFGSADADLPRVKTCTHCGQPAVSWFWSKDQGFVGWCREHINTQTIVASP